jgi:hypothetical protein
LRSRDSLYADAIPPLLLSVAQYFFSTTNKLSFDAFRYSGSPPQPIIVSLKRSRVAHLTECQRTCEVRRSDAKAQPKTEKSGPSSRPTSDAKCPLTTTAPLYISHADLASLWGHATFVITILSFLFVLTTTLYTLFLTAHQQQPFTLARPVTCALPAKAYPHIQFFAQPTKNPQVRNVVPCKSHQHEHVPNRSSKPKASMPTIAKSTSSTDWLGIFSLGVCFLAALVINIIFLYGLLQMLAPRLPLACLSIYGSGYGLMLLIGHFEKQEEEMWTKARLNEKVELPVIIEGLEEDF